MSIVSLLDELSIVLSTGELDTSCREQFAITVAGALKITCVHDLVFDL